MGALVESDIRAFLEIAGPRIPGPSRADRGLELKKDQRLALFEIALRSGNMPRRGRPKKGCYQPTWTDFGLTRQEVHRMRRLNEFPDEEFAAYACECQDKGKPITCRGVLVRFGKINVATEDIFEGIPTGELAEACLRRVERIFREMNRRQRPAFLHALRSRLQCIAATADWEGEG